MKKIKPWEAIAVGVVALTLGVILSLQFRVVQNNLLGGLVPSTKSAELASELKKLKEEKAALQEKLTEVEETLNNFEEAASKDNLVLKNLRDELSKYRKIGGFTDVHGPGVTITMDNPPEDLTFGNSNRSIIYDYKYVVMIINELNAAGAEAISVNGQRIIATTEIRQAGDAININSIPQSAPITIEAIGEPDTLMGALNARFALVEILRNNEYQVEIRKMSDIQIGKYSGVVNFKYADDIEK